MKEVLTQAQNWRYATKKYDPLRKISQDDLDTLMESVRMSVSSMGLQPYRVLVISDRELRLKLRAAAFDQDAVSESSYLFVFAASREESTNQIDQYLRNISATREISLESLGGFKQMMHKFVDGLSEENRMAWAEKQCYIAMANLIGTASLLKIDATPMEGFDAGKFDEILKLEDQGLQTVVIAAVGYRHRQDKAQHYKKVRKSKEELFIHL